MSGLDVTVKSREGKRKVHSVGDVYEVDVYDGKARLGIIFLGSGDRSDEVTFQVGILPVKVIIQPDAGSLVTVYQKS